MFNWGWTPSYDLPAFGSTVFKAGVYVSGLPYSLTPYQCDGDGSLTNGHGNEYGLGYYFSGGFENAMNQSNFYTPLYYGTDDYPRYGNDCSGFASIAYDCDRMNTDSFELEIANGTKFKKVGTYTIKDYYQTGELQPCYALLDKADGLVRNRWEDDKLIGHVMIVGANFATGLIAYEQKKPKVTIEFKYYEDHEESNYMPFTYF